ncbi:MAG: hypothetical protein FWD97_00700 [Defluviitaleaceae bacterium]|nr:hypothetical protein [Defluviitaleaceae bacterium]
MKLNSQTIYFNSKRNQVRLIDGRVEKVHATSEKADFEASRLTQLYKAGLDVPKVIDVVENVVIMEYINAKPLPDLIDEWEQNPDVISQEKAAKGLVEWLEAFYKAVDTGESRGDINGRNFLFDGEKIWGVDFEEVAHGTPLEDIGQLLAFITTYHPAHTDLKIRLSRIIAQWAAEIFRIDPTEIKRQQELAVEFLQSRRKGIK